MYFAQQNQNFLRQWRFPLNPRKPLPGSAPPPTADHCMENILWKCHMHIISLCRLCVSVLREALTLYGWGGGHWPRKRGWRCAALKTPFSCLPRSSKGTHLSSPYSSQGSHFKIQFTCPLVRKTGILNSTISIFAQILDLKPKNLKILIYKTPLSGSMISS